MAMQQLTAHTVATESAADEAWSEMEAREKEIFSREERVPVQEAGLASRGCEVAAREETEVVREEAREAVAETAAPEAGFLDRGEHLVELTPDEES